MTKDLLLNRLRGGKTLSRREQLKLILLLSIPAILAQLSAIIMEYIDAAMVGQLGAQPVASIGLVAPLTWVFFGVCSAAVTGFAVQVAQQIGAKDEPGARNTFKQGAMIVLGFSVILSLIALSISKFVPQWLRGEADIQEDAFWYFLIFMGAIPIMATYRYCAGMLQCIGNIKLPSMIHILMGILDVIFNYFLIFPTRTVTIASAQFEIWGAGLGVRGAALGSVLAAFVAAILMVCAILHKNCPLRPRPAERFSWNRVCNRRAVKISIPIAFEHCVLSGALVVTTIIIAPLGAISLAANGLAVTAESLCYMPAFGLADAATTLIGQSIGAKRYDLTRKLAFLTIAIGILMMTGTGALLYALAPWMFLLLTPVDAIRELGAKILRIEAFAEPLYGAAIISSGCLRGAGDTLVPSLMNLFSMWGVRITLSFILVDSMGLIGVWIAMASELSFRGLILLARVIRKDWSKCRIIQEPSQ